MLDQGIDIDDIIVYNDSKHEGNLRACMNAFSIVDDDYKGTWHLQDDVLICSDFKKRTEELEEHDGVICAFSCLYDDDRKPGIGTVEGHMWWSFPCIRIPNKIAKECATWADIYVWRDNQYGFWIRHKKGDDVIFRVFMESYHPNDEVLNLAPNLVEHIDFLLGGSLVNKQRTMKNVRSGYFDEPELVNNLREELFDK